MMFIIHRSNRGDDVNGELFLGDNNKGGDAGRRCS
jgi:hypothetical protein